MMYNMMPYFNTSVFEPVTTSLQCDPFFRSFFGLDAVQPSGFKTAVQKEDDHYLITAELPGVPADSIHVSIENDVLTIAVATGNKADDTSADQTVNRSFCQMTRSFGLENIDQDQIKANYENGLLSIRLPMQKLEETKKLRTIAITTGSTAQPALDAASENL